ncbi:hypothetical protein WBG78_16245 [Chryseolinea sp. T2]|uniref:hypothetical protein n=1 Tax=Chryseolinea sp. T2 TaxID=3129255 RepID=UPI0030774FBA
MTSKGRRNAVIILTVFLAFWGCEEFFRRKIGGFAGSYPFVESWELEASESEVIAAIVELKKENPGLQPPGETELFKPRKLDYDWDTDEMKTYFMLHLKDSTVQPPAMTKANTTSSPYWLYVNFYYAGTKQVVHAWTRPAIDTTNTTFAFVSLSPLGNPSDQRLINRDFWYVANKIEIWKFKSRFVDQIRERIERNRMKR